MSACAQSCLDAKVPVKATVWVDEGIAPLVLALTELENVVTLASDEGGPERDAHVRLGCRDGDLAGLRAMIAGRLAGHAGNVAYRLRMLRPSDGSAGGPVLELACSPRQVMSLALALRASRGRRPVGERDAARGGGVWGRRSAVTGRPQRHLRALSSS
jgi:hypothetical protein